MILKLTKSDLMTASVPAKNLWYHMEVTKVEVALSAKQDSHNITITGILMGGDKPHQSEFEGKQVTKLYNSKLIGMIVPALKALGIEIEEGFDLNTDVLKKELPGMKADVFVTHREWQGQPQPELSMWLPFGVSDALPS